jgi:hypothetical protein
MHTGTKTRIIAHGANSERRRRRFVLRDFIKMMRRRQEGTKDGDRRENSKRVPGVLSSSELLTMADLGAHTAFLATNFSTTGTTTTTAHTSPPLTENRVFKSSKIEVAIVGIVEKLTRAGRGDARNFTSADVGG